MRSRLIVTIMLVGATLAGCVGSDKAPGGIVAIPIFSHAPSFKLGPIPSSGSVSEPSIAVDHTGAMYVSAPAGLPSGSALWKSTDGGATWKSLAPNPTPLGGGDTSIAIAPDNSIYVTDLWAGSATVSSSHDGGANWFSSPIASQVPYYDREWNTVDKEGRGYFLGRTFTPAVATWVSRSDDGGKTWVFAGNPWINPDNSVEQQDGPLIVNPKTDEVAVVFNCAGPAVCVSISKDQGATWTQHVAAKAQGSVGNDFAGLAADSSGTWYVTYAELLSSGSVIKVASSKDGATWSAPQTLTTGAGTRVFPWIVAGDAGRVAVTWYDTPVPGNSNDATAMSAAQWDVMLAQSTDAASSTPHWDLTHVTPQPIHKGTISTVGLSPGGPDRSLGDFFTMDVGPDGNVHLAFMGDLGSGLTCIVANQVSGPTLNAPGHVPPTATTSPTTPVPIPTLPITPPAPPPVPAKPPGTP